MENEIILKVNIMATCISRGPKTTSTSQHETITHSTNNNNQQQCNQIIKIYTEWGNHYLKKAHFKRLIQNLQIDLSDGVLLADVVEAVCYQKVPNVNRKPKSVVHMVDNIVNSLQLLEKIGVILDGITAKDVKDGNLKTILGLFFSLSKYKQQQKQQQAVQVAQNSITSEKLQQKRQHLIPPSDDMKQSRLPSPYYSQQSGSSGGTAVTSIPTPLSQRPSRTVATGLNSLKCSSSANSSRSVSPSHSFIPTPKIAINPSPRSSLNERQLISGRGNKIPTGHSLFSLSVQSNKSNSVIDKVKVVSVKEKCKSVVSSNTSISSTKRTSSSSGVSSTRSERSSDSSNSLCNDVKSSLNNESKETTVSFNVNELKPTLKKKVMVKPIETRVLKLPTKSPFLRTEEKNVECGTSSHKDENRLSMNESSRLSSSGIPKPTAAVKGMTKPTNSVAPMPIVKPEIDGKSIMSTENGLEEKEKVDSFHRNETSGHSKQSSLGEDVEASLANIKPMEPLLRGYKRSIVFSRRILPTTNPYIGQRALPNCPTDQTYHSSRFEMKKAGENKDFDISSGYVSDGDVLQANNSPNCKFYNDIEGGYMSEGGAQFYERYSNNIDSNKLAKKIENITLSSTNDSNMKQMLPSRGQSTDVTALSCVSRLHKFSNKLNGKRSAVDESTSLPESTPTLACVYNSQFLSSPSCVSPPEPTPVVYRVVGARSHVKKIDSGQQTDSNAFRSNVNNIQWKGYPDSDIGTTSPRTSVLMNGDGARLRDKHNSYTETSNASNIGSLLRNKMDKRRMSSTSSQGSREEINEVDFCYGERKSRSDGKSKVRGVPSSFGYVKRSTSASNKESRTAQVSAVPRTKVKVSGGTQTDIRAYSPNPPSSSQLSQNARDRSLLGPNGVPRSPARALNSIKSTDKDSLPESLSDSTYVNLQAVSNSNSSLFRDGSPCIVSLPTRTIAATGLLDANSIESLPAQLQHRASLTNARLLTNSGSFGVNATNRLSRSNSIRSTKSEKLYPSMMQRSDELESFSIPYSLASVHNLINVNYSGQDELPSPTPSHLSQEAFGSNGSRYNYLASPSSSNQSFSRNSPYMNFLTKINSKEDMNGSAMSLLSTASSSLYSTAEDKHALEVRKLQKDLSEAQHKVHSLTSQISTNAHVVSAFQDSLTKMTEKLQQLTATNERKNSELIEARKMIEKLKKQSCNGENKAIKESLLTHNCSPSLARRHTINTTTDSSNNISRQLSADSVSSLVSMSSACSMSSGNQHTDLTAMDKNKKKRGWLRSSFSKAFSKSKKNKNGSVSDIEDSRTTQSDMSAPSSPLLNSLHIINGNLKTTMKNSQSSSVLHETADEMINKNECGLEMVQKLKKELREKDMVLTDIRLESLSLADQLESLKDTVMKMRNDMLILKQDNERLQRIVTSKSLVSSQSSLQAHDNMDRRYSMTDVPNGRTELNSMFTNPTDVDAKKVVVYVFSGSHGGYHKYVEESNERNDIPISLIPVSTKTNWETLDNLVFKAFKDHLDRVDPATNLQLNQDSIWSYHVGEIVRYKDSKEPELLPCGYLVGGSSSSITVCLKGALHSGCTDALAFKLLIPKSIIERYVSLLDEHRRLILHGPSGTGKTSIANELVEYMLYRDGKEITPNTIVSFNVDEKNSKDMRQYLSNLAEQYENPIDNHELPMAVILDNLHLAASLSDVLNAVLNVKNDKCHPYVIGILNQASCSTSSLQLHLNFKWILCANHLEPVKGFLSRYLRRRLIEIECKKDARNAELWRIIDWIPKIQLYLNQFLETRISADVTIGPKLFMSCPMEVDGSQVWFTDLWNYSLVPYLLDAVRDGQQLYGKSALWEDPSLFIKRNYPWCKSTNVHGGIETLMRLRPEDVGYEVKSESDPLLNMLMTLQEAANYSSSTRNNETNSGANLNVTDCNKMTTTTII